MHETFELRPDERLAVITLRGELDAHDAPDLRELFTRAVAEASTEGEPRLVLDLTAVSFLDSTALGSIVGAVRRVRESGGKLDIVLPETSARRIFELTGLDAVLSVRATRDEALAG